MGYRLLHCKDTNSQNNVLMGKESLFRSGHQECPGPSGPNAPPPRCLYPTCFLKVGCSSK